MDGIPRPRASRTLPVVLSMEEVEAFFAGLRSRKHRAILMTAYAGGLRVSEVISVRISDIDSNRMMIWIRQAKRRKDRYIPLTKHLLTILREYWMAARPKDYLFPGTGKTGRITPQTVDYACKAVMHRAGLKKNVSPHTLRHYAEFGIIVIVLRRNCSKLARVLRPLDDQSFQILGFSDQRSENSREASRRTPSTG